MLLILKTILFPFSLLYGVGVSGRSMLYRTGILRSTSFGVPVISIGNLSAGGTGKTPMTEYLIRMLEGRCHAAVLSRGYGRGTKGFRMVTPQSTAAEAGDEPAQIRKKFPRVPVAVGEDRITAIPHLLAEAPGTQAVLLDDAFQHRAVRPALSILLTDYSRPFTRDLLLPAGRLREWRCGYRRADVIVVTRTPENTPPEEKERLVKEISPLPHQKIFFAGIRHGAPYPISALLSEAPKSPPGNADAALLVTGIANPEALVKHVESRYKRFAHLRYNDHHAFSTGDLKAIKKTFDGMTGTNKIILTTEKDTVRLLMHEAWLETEKPPIYCVPVEITFSPEDKIRFERRILEAINSYKKSS